MTEILDDAKEAMKMKCKICDNESDNIKYLATERMFSLKDEFEYFQCSKCNCLQLNEIPEDISKYYLGNYYAHYDIDKKSPIKNFLINQRNNYVLRGKGLIGKLAYKFFPNDELSSLKPINITKDTSILDIGCGRALLLNALRDLGFENTMGVDPFIENEFNYENGLVVKKMNLEDVKEQWDVIMFHHSFEHVSNPFEILEVVSRLLKPNGTCIIRIPVACSYAWEFYKTDWVQLDAPRHYFLHTIDSMKILADKTKMKITDTVYDSTAFQFWGSEQYLKNISLVDNRSIDIGKEKSIFTKEEIAEFTKRAKELNKENRGDQAIFYLKRL